MTSTLQYTTTYHVITCCYEKCGVSFALSEGYVRERQKDHAWWYCPNGHRQHWGQKNEAEELREKLDTAKRSAEFWRDETRRAEQNNLATKRQLAAAKGRITRIKNRIANGVCPVGGCKRSFTNIHDHIHTCHPDFVIPEETS